MLSCVHRGGWLAALLSPLLSPFCVVVDQVVTVKSGCGLSPLETGCTGNPLPCAA